MIRGFGPIVLLLAALGCGNEAPPPAEPGPYVVTAIDYHFHDAHPSLPIAPERAVQFSNQGTNVHNVTIPGTGFDRFVRPGRRLTIPRIGALLPDPGRYRFFCALHVDRGMRGVLVVTG